MTLLSDGDRETKKHSLPVVSARGNLVDSSPDRAGREAPVWAPPVGEPRSRDLCTDCGISRTEHHERCGKACQFIAPRYSTVEEQVHGRARDSNRPDELYFGPYRRMLRARLQQPLAHAQWSGIATRIGARLLETQAVDAVLAMAADPSDRWKPRPVLVTTPEAMSECRGMKMGYAPLLALLEPALRQGYKRLAVIGIPCQVYPLRTLEKQLGLERLYVIGTPCSDNTTTEKFHQFLALLSKQPETIEYLEFCSDYHVELRFTGGRVQRIPFLALPLSTLPRDFFPLTCKSCVDYTNVLSDLTVGYMGGEGEQWLIVRNERGEELVELLGSELISTTPGTGGKRERHVAAYLTNLIRAAGGLPLQRAPRFIRPLMSWLMPRIGPRGLEFARARVEMKALEAVVHLRQERPHRLKGMIPPHVWTLAARYGLVPGANEKR